MDKLLDKLKEIWAKIVSWWGAFTSKQRTAIVVMAVFVIFVFVGLYALLTSPNYTLLKQCDSTKEASQVTAILDEAGVKYKVSDDGLQIKVPKNDLSVANLSLGASGITSDPYSIESALSGSLTTTEADKKKKYELFLESQFENDFLVYFTAIKSAKVDIYLPDNDGTLLAKQEEAGAAIVLEIDGDFTSDNAAFLANAVATTLGCSNTNNIVIMDRSANLLFSGADDNSGPGAASSQLGVKNNAEELMNSNVKKVLQGTGVFGDVKVSTNLDIDFSSTTSTNHTYTPADGQSQGLLGEEKSYTSESQGGTSGVPGTDSNTEDSYYYSDNDYSSSTIEELYKKYLPNESIVSTEIPPGTIHYDKSSVAVSSVTYKIVSEDDVEAQGLLTGISWAEYQAANSERKPIEITDEMITLVSNATGIPQNNINIVAYEENFFVDSENKGINIADIIPIVLIAVILILLVVVVIKSMHQETVTEEPEEISVDSLLQSNPEETLDNIEVEESSETKKLIEKFVDENPEAVANLLRNWLNEDWS